MQTEDLETHLYELIVDLCAVLYERGYRSVPMGAMMRLIGVSDSEASQHDDTVFELDAEFEQILEERNYFDHEEEELSQPPGVTLH